MASAWCKVHYIVRGRQSQAKHFVLLVLGFVEDSSTVRSQDINFNVAADLKAVRFYVFDGCCVQRLERCEKCVVVKGDYFEGK